MNKLITLFFAFAILIAGTAYAGSHYGKNKMKKMKPDIVDVALSDKKFSTLVAALKAADLVTTLKSDGPFTVFAPTNEAFAKLPEGTLDSLLKPENKSQLVSVLTYHVLPKKVMAKDIVSMGKGKVKTVQGEKMKINTSKGVMVDNANVVKTDIMAKNGVIHVIDSVILPPSKS